MTTDTQTESVSIIAPAAPQLPAVAGQTSPAATSPNGQRGRLALALSRAQAKCRAVAPDKRNQFHKYDYASAEAVIGEAKEALAESGLALVPIEQNITGSSKDGEDRFELERKFLLLHDSGEMLPISLHWPVIVEKGRPLDKAAAAAATSSLAYLLRDLLMMPRVKEADDISSREDKPAQQPAPAPKPSKPKKAPPANGTELYERLQNKGIDVLKAVVAAGAKAAFPHNMAEWNAAQIGYGVDIATAFVRAQAERPKSQGGQHASAPPDREPGEPEPGEVVGPAEVSQLDTLRNKVGISWGDCLKWLNRELKAGLPEDANPESLTHGQFGPLAEALRARATKKAG